MNEPVVDEKEKGADCWGCEFEFAEVSKLPEEAAIRERESREMIVYKKNGDEEEERKNVYVICKAPFCPFSSSIASVVKGSLA